MNGILNNGAVCLRAPELEDLDLLFGLENDVALWTVSSNVMPYSRFQLEKYIRESAHDLYLDRQVRFIVADVTTATAMGCIDMTDVDLYNGRAEVGIALLPEFRGKGMALQALQLLCGYAERMLHLHQLFAYIPADNEDSVQLFAAQGFVQSGCLRDWLCRGAQYLDVTVWQKIF